jgi:hypothetical protein
MSRAKCSTVADVPFLEICISSWLESRGTRDLLGLLQDGCSDYCSRKYVTHWLWIAFDSLYRGTRLRC